MTLREKLTKKKHRRYQIGLKCFVATITAICLLTWAGQYANEMYFQPPPIVRALRESGNLVDWADESGGDSLWITNRNENISSLRVHQIGELTALERNANGLTSINSFALYDNRATTTKLDFISRMSSLESVSIGVVHLADLSFLNDLPSVRSISLTCPIESPRILCGLSKLQSLSLYQTVGLDLSFLENFESLETLTIRGTFSDVTSLGRLRRIQSISLQDSNAMNDGTSDFPREVVELRAALPFVWIRYNDQEIDTPRHGTE